MKKITAVHALPNQRFHAFYGDAEAVFEISALRMIEGALPNRARSLVLD